MKVFEVTKHHVNSESVLDLKITALINLYII